MLDERGGRFVGLLGSNNHSEKERPHQILGHFSTKHERIPEVLLWFCGFVVILVLFPRASRTWVFCDTLGGVEDVGRGTSYLTP